MTSTQDIRDAETRIGYGVAALIGLGLLSVPLSNQWDALLALVVLSVALVALYLFYRLVVAVEHLTYEP